MARPNEELGLRAAWRALGGGGQTEGWRTIAIASSGPCRIVAGRRYPENEEALLVGFATATVPPTDQMPRGRGFHVSRADTSTSGLDGSWIAVSRKAGGTLDLFELMAEDLVASISVQGGLEEHRILQAVISRIRAWQDFMQREGDGVLGAEAELGLLGELHVLSLLLGRSVDLYSTVDAWKGPVGGVQDFLLGSGAIEVKSTAAPAGFVARIGSLMQLDDSLIRPLFLAGVRLTQVASGNSLPEMIDFVRSLLATDPLAIRLFETRLLHAGYLTSAAAHYTRTFRMDEMILIRVSDATPRLVRGNVSVEIRDATYELDLDLIQVGRVGFVEALAELGAN